MGILKKDLRPISLTPCLSKVAEEFIVADYIKPAVLKDLDTNQYGAVPKSSTTLAVYRREQCPSSAPVLAIIKALVIMNF